MAGTISENASDDQNRRRIRYLLTHDSPCWSIYNEEFIERDHGLPRNLLPPHETRKQLLAISIRLSNEPSDLCCVCRCIDFGYFYSGGTPSSAGAGKGHMNIHLLASRVIPLGLIQDMNNSGCPLCRLAIRSTSERVDGVLAWCFLSLEKYYSKRAPRLKLSFYEYDYDYELTSDPTPRGREALYKSPPDANHDPPEWRGRVRYSYIHTISLTKIGGGLAGGGDVALDAIPSGRVVAPTVNFPLLKAFLEPQIPPTKKWKWRLAVVASSLRRMINASLQIPPGTGSPSTDDSLERGHGGWKLPTNFRVIDVSRRCIVNPDPDACFVALSYVWGKLTRPHLVNTKAISAELYLPDAVDPRSEHLPRTVRDAMIATASLGYQYLWVDALCIIQDSDEDKQDQLRRMDAVYNLASVTFVATAGTDADAGLPGVGSTSRLQWQYVFGRGSARFANIGEDLEEAIESSRWMTRGWTYQEFALSSRLLIFTAAQAFFVDARRGDSLDSSFGYRRESNVSLYIQRGGIASSFTSHIASKPLDALGIYNNAVETYSIRELTFQNDILNAFEGIANYLRPGFRSGFTFGLPNSFLELGLMWIAFPPRNGTTCVREGFPQYSWASREHKASMWRRPISSWPSSRVLWKNFSPERKKDWLCEDDIMPRVGSEEIARWRFLPKGTPLRRSSGPDGKESLSVTQPYWEDIGEHPRWQHARPLLPPELLPPFQPADPRTGSLCFWTHVIHLVLVRSGMEDLMWMATSGQLEEDGAAAATAAATASKGIKIGDFNMDSPNFPNPIDLVLLCCFEPHTRLPYFERFQKKPSSSSSISEDGIGTWHIRKFKQDAADVRSRSRSGSEEEHFPWSRDNHHYYAVLAVETIHGVSYRRGVGTIDLSWFHRARPESRCIVLG